MIPHSSEYEKALLFPQKEYFVKLELYDYSMNYLDEISKQVSSSDIGSITVDRSRPIRRNFNFSLVNKNGNYTWNNNNLIWIDKRVKVYTGLKLANGTVEFIPQGVFICTEPQTSNTLSGSVTSISGQDKAFLYNDKRGKFVNETIITEGISITTAIKTIAEGENLFLFDDITDTVPYELTYNATDNRWKAMQDLAAFAKAEIFYDINGYLRLRKISDLNDYQNESAVWTFIKGDMFYAGNVRKMDETDLYNHFVAIGSGTVSEVVRDEIVVTESNPLFANSPFSIEKIGRITYFHNDGNADPVLLTVDDCHFRNKYELMRKLGYSEKVSLSTAPLFILDVMDIIQIDDETNGVTGRYMIDKLDIPLKPDMTPVECSKQVSVVENWSLL